MTDNRWARKPKPESQITELRSYYYAFDADGTFKGEVKLTAESKERYESKGYTFRRRK